MLLHTCFRGWCILLMVLALGLSAHANDLLVQSDGTPSAFRGVLRYDGTSGAFLGVFISHPNDRSLSMTYGPDGNLYLGRLDSLSVTRHSGQTGALLNTLVPTASGGLATPWDMTFGPDGNLYVATDGTAAPGVLRYNGTTGAFIDRFVVGSATGLTFGPDGNLHVSHGDRIGRYDGTSGAFLGDLVATGSGGLGTGFHLRFGPDGNVYVAAVEPGIKRFNGTTGAFLGDVASELNGAYGVLFGPDGNLYGGNGFTSGVDRFDLSSGALIDHFVAAGSGGLGHTRTSLFMIPEPGAMLGLCVFTLLSLRRRA